MPEPLTYWFLLPTGLAISAIYSSSGVSGANFWALVYIVGLRLEPRIGFWLALLSMLFGSLGGLFAHARRRSLRPRIAAGYLVSAIPAAVLGTLAASALPVPILLAAFGIFLLAYATGLLLRLDAPSLGHRRPRHRFGLCGGFLTGLISVGVGELLLPEALDRDQLRSPAEAAGTTLLVVCLTSLTAALARLQPSFIETLADRRAELASILIWVLPGVLLGSQLGPLIARRLDRGAMKVYVSMLLLVVGMLMLWRGIRV